jgi:Spy/CpxP family protein refolding chaperone
MQTSHSAEGQAGKQQLTRAMYKCLAVTVVLMALPGLALAQHSHSPYTGQEAQPIKALSEDDIQALRDGRGMGLAKAAELNHYPGPLHVLELAAPLHLSDTQRAETQKIYDQMRQEAMRLGQLIVAEEQDLNRLFATQEVNSVSLRAVISEIARLQGDLRLVHLQAHVDMQRLLSAEQIAAYEGLRGYSAGGRTEAPTGHHRGQH